MAQEATKQDREAPETELRSDFFQCAAEALLIVDAERILDANPAAAELFGVSAPSRLVGSRPPDLAPACLRDGEGGEQAWHELTDRAHRFGQASRAWMLRTPAGTSHQVELQLTRADAPQGPLFQARLWRTREQGRQEAAFRRILSILDSTPDVVTMHDATGAMLFANRAAREFFGLGPLESGVHWCGETGWNREGLPSAATGVAGTVRQVHPPDEAERILNEALPAATRDGVWRGETALLNADGERVPVSGVLIVHTDCDGAVRQTSTIFRDIRAFRDLQHRLQKEKRFTETLLERLPGVLYVLDPAGNLLRWNEQLARRTGYHPGSMNGVSLLSLFPEHEGPGVMKAIREAHRSGETTIEARLDTAEGERPYMLKSYWMEIQGRPYILGVGMDITDQKALEETLAREASIDHLTGVANRHRFDEELARALARHDRNGNRVALILLDLDHFKAINDTYGHELGDDVLVQLAERIDASLREPDMLARWGGEEFTILLPDTGLQEARTLAQRIRRCIAEEPVPGVGHVTASAGVTAIHEEEDVENPARELFKAADDAVYQAKQLGRDRVVVRALPSSEGHAN